MTDPFLLDQKEVELTLRRLEEAVAVWRTMQKERRSEFSDSLEYELQGVESSIRNGIRDVKWSLEDLEETLKLMSQNNGHFMDSENVATRRKFLESARRTLTDVEFEITSPSLDAVIGRQQQEISSVKQSDITQEPEKLTLLRTDSDEQIVFSKSNFSQPEQHSTPKKPQPVATMVSLNLDTVRDLVEPQEGRRGLKTTKAMVRWLVRYRCWLFLLLLVAFFFILVLMKALSRAAQLDATTPTAWISTTECPLDDYTCI